MPWFAPYPISRDSDRLAPNCKEQYSNVFGKDIPAFIIEAARMILKPRVEKLVNNQTCGAEANWYRL